MAARKEITITDAFLGATRRIPELAIASVVSPKFELAGLSEPELAARSFARHVISGKIISEFEWDDEKDIVVQFDEDDLQLIQRKIGKTLDDLPDLSKKIMQDISAKILDRLTSEWHSYRRLEERSLQQFRMNIEYRWGKALDLLRIMHSLSLEEGESFAEAINKSRAKNGLIRRSAISKLHIRSCQVVAEIITLLENGFSDGAIARWRTLHELLVVSYVIEDGGDAVAQEYLDHVFVENKRALDTYLKVYDQVGYDPPDQQEVDDINAKYENVRNQYGNDFLAPFGWACKYLNQKSPRFSDIEAAAGRAQLRYHYKLASYNVHASPKSLFDRIGILPNYSGLIAGATNAGLDKVGRNVAFSLTQLTYLVTKRYRKIEEAIALNCIVELRDLIDREFVRAAQELEQDDILIRGATSGLLGANDVDIG